MSRGGLGREMPSMSSRDPARRRAADGANSGATPAVLLAVALMLGAPAVVRAQGRAGAQDQSAADWVGRRVVAKSPTLVLHGGPREIALDGYYRYRIKQVHGRRLLVEAEGLGVGGWTAADQVIPIEQATEYFTERIRSDPGDAFAYIMRAISWRETKDFDRELADLTQAAALEPANAHIYVLRGQMRFARGEYDAALADGNRAIRLDVEDGLAHQLRGVARCRKQDYAGAIADLSRAIQLRPRSVEGYVNRGSAWFESGDYNKAILDLTTAIRLDPENALAYTNRGLAWFYKGKYESAIADLDRAIRLEPKDAILYARRAYAWLNLGKLDAALADSEHAVRLDPRCAEARVARGSVSQRRGEPDAALADFDEAIRIDPRNAMAHFGRGSRPGISQGLRRGAGRLHRSRPARSDDGDRLQPLRLDPGDMPRSHAPGRHEGCRVGEARLRPDEVACRPPHRYAGGVVCRGRGLRYRHQMADQGHRHVPRGQGEVGGRGAAEALPGQDGIPSARSVIAPECHPCRCAWRLGR